MEIQKRITRLFQFRFVRHLAVGGIGVVINWFSFIFFNYYTVLNLFVIVLISQLLVLSFMFSLQKNFTFKYKKNSNAYLRFIINSLVYFLLDYFLTYFFIVILDFYPAFGKFLTLFILTPISFLIQNFWVFKK